MGHRLIPLDEDEQAFQYGFHLSLVYRDPVTLSFMFVELKLGHSGLSHHDCGLGNM